MKSRRGKVELIGYKKRLEKAKKQTPKYKEGMVLAEKITKLTGVNLFEQTRKRKVIEGRATLTFVLYNMAGMTLSEIRDFYEQNGKPYDHATALHALNNFDMYRRYNKDINEWLKELIGEEDDVITIRKRALVIQNIRGLSSQSIDELYQITENMYENQIVENEAVSKN